jgi:hypothetical protein
MQAADPLDRFRAAEGPSAAPGTTEVIELHVIDAPVEGLGYDESTPAGAMWRVPSEDRDGRECWAVMLPNDAGVWWTTMRAAGSGTMWEVEGTAPAITVKPSILVPGLWHGWITDGRFA